MDEGWEDEYRKSCKRETALAYLSLGIFIAVVLVGIGALGYVFYDIGETQEACEEQCLPFTSRVRGSMCECANEQGHWVPQEARRDVHSG